MNVPEHLQYTRDHEWAEVTGPRVKVGVTDYAQDALGDVVFVQVPTIGQVVQVGMTFSEIESTKSVSDVYAPVSGTVVEVNTELSEAPQKINEDPYGAGWLCVIEAQEPTASLEHFLDAGAYRSLVGE